MATISVSLDDETFARLKAAADAENRSVEELIAGLAEDRARIGAEALEARSAAARHLQHYPRLFERLAE